MEPEGRPRISAFNTTARGIRASWASQGYLLRQAGRCPLRPLSPTGSLSIGTLAHSIFRHHQIVGATGRLWESLGRCSSRGAEFLRVAVVASERPLVDLVVRVAGRAGGSPGECQIPTSSGDGQRSPG